MSNCDVDSALEECRSIAKRLENEVKSATRVWCIVEAFNGSDEKHRKGLHSTLNTLCLGLTTNTLIKALTRDTLSGLFRVTDTPGPKNERLTFCRIRKFLDEESVTLALEEIARNWNPAFGQTMQKLNVETIRLNVQHIVEVVPFDWKNAELSDKRLLSLRQKLHPLRNHLLAHALDDQDIQHPSFGEIRNFLKIVAELQGACSLIFLGASGDLQSRWDIMLREAHEFWDLMPPQTQSDGK